MSLIFRKCGHPFQYLFYVLVKEPCRIFFCNRKTQKKRGGRIAVLVNGYINIVGIAPTCRCFGCELLCFDIIVALKNSV